MATTNGRLDDVEFLISRGVDLSASNMEKYTIWVLQLRDFCTEIIIHATQTQNVLCKKGKKIRELTSVVQKRFEFLENNVELYAEKDNNKVFCAIAQLSDGAPGASASALATPSSPDRMNLMTLYFLDEVVPHDEYIDEMFMMKEIQTAPALEFSDDVIVVDDLFEATVGPVEGASNFVDPPISFDVLSGFVSRSDDIFDIEDEIAQHDSNDDSSFSFDLDSIDKRVLPAAEDTEVKEEIQKQLSMRFLSMVEYPEWLTNVVLVPKKDCKVKVCVDFQDLNKASPKDDFPLPHIDMLVDSTTGHSMFSFMDGFFRYNQILMALENMMTTSFITEWDTYCYRVMLFGLKNAGATYQRASTTLFHDMMHRDVEVYVDDMIVKSRDRANHLAALERFFERIRQFKLRLNPKKCTFGVTSGKLLGYIVNERGIEADPNKIKAILDMSTPRNEREIRGFLGRL
ncbi:hypothetical protein VitviT2T_006837 [Vitis vinifera]|uniref:Transposon Ty3-I Gag-Pol polyprotein n=1 Tax=Vitis vinifera TaxID=29760 RepID=A0ABY9BXG4_VITVI|nr:hypothetical protein VitviT2T_006837 [Vitis vinifera]